MREDTWSWLKEEKTNSFSYNKEVFSGGKKVAIILALTSDIDISRVSSVCDFDVVYKLDAGENSVDCIRSEDDLKEFWHKYQEMFDEIKNLYPDVTEVSLFPSVPVSAAFAVGSRYMQGWYCLGLPLMLQSMLLRTKELRAYLFLSAFQLYFR